VSYIINECKCVIATPLTVMQSSSTDYSREAYDCSYFQKKATRVIVRAQHLDKRANQAVALSFFKLKKNEELFQSSSLTLIRLTHNHLDH